MLSSVSFFRGIVKTNTKLIYGENWISTNEAGRATLISCSEAGPTPGHIVMFGVGTCMGACLKFLLEKSGIKFTDINVETEANWTGTPNRITDLKLNITTDADIDQEKLNKLINQAEEKLCSVAATLKNKAKVEAVGTIKHK